MARKKAEPKIDVLDFEGALRLLEDIVTKLEGGEAGLEESLKFFEKGVAAARRCRNLLDDAEKRVTMLVGDDDAVEVDFETGEVIGEEEEWDEDEV